MIAVDTNILVYAHCEESFWHDAALAKIAELAKGARRGPFRGPAFTNFLR